MTRIYLRLAVDFDDDEKVARLARYGKDARGIRDLLVGMWRYCKREKSDGHVPEEIVGKLVYPDSPRIGVRDADRLVAVGIAERTADGYLLAGFLKHNKSREEIDAESARKAEAGKIGGFASGKVRKGEADTKQTASEARSHSSEFREQSSESTTELGLRGDRPVPLRAVPATEPPNNDDETCTRHPNGNPTDEPCRGCQRVEQRKTQRVEAAAEADRRGREEAARTCTRCDGVWLLDENRNITRRKCNHRRTA